MLAARFPSPEWAYFEQVRNGTGYSRRVTRTADALAFSLYPSRGLELHGFEVKVSRGDWLRERKDPEKAEEIAKYCNEWWLVTSTDVVFDVSEIPPAWGWLDMPKLGKQLLVRKKPKWRTAKPLDLPMVASILRKASETAIASYSDRLRINLDASMEEERSGWVKKQQELAAKSDEQRERAQRLPAHHPSDREGTRRDDSSA